MVGTLRLVGPSVRQLLHQLNPTQKLNENRQPSEGRNCPQRVADFELSSAKERPKVLPIVLFRSLRRIFYHNLFSHQCLEQNEASFNPPNFGFWAERSIHVFSKKFFGPPHSRKAVSGKTALAVVSRLVGVRGGATEFVYDFFAKACCGGRASRFLRRW